MEVILLGECNKEIPVNQTIIAAVYNYVRYLFVF